MPRCVVILETYAEVCELTNINLMLLLYIRDGVDGDIRLQVLHQTKTQASSNTTSELITTGRNWL